MKGCAIGSSVLRQRAKKGGITQHQENFQLPQEQIQANIRDAYKRFQKLKVDPDRRDMWISNLIHAQAQAMGKTKKSLWKQH